MHFNAFFYVRKTTSIFQTNFCVKLVKKKFFKTISFKSIRRFKIFTMKFSNVEYVDFIFYYGMARGDANEAKRLYEEAFPNRHAPNRAVFVNTYTRARETGCVSHCSGDRTRGSEPHVEDAVLEAVEEDPRTSVRKISRAKMCLQLKYTESSSVINFTPSILHRFNA